MAEQVQRIIFYHGATLRIPSAARVKITGTPSKLARRCLHPRPKHTQSRQSEGGVHLPRPPGTRPQGGPQHATRRAYYATCPQLRRRVLT